MAAHRRVHSVAFCGRKRIIAVGSQQRMRSRHQARRGPQDCKNRAARVREAPRRILRCAHAGNETISPGGRKPPVLCRTSQHDMRATIPGSCFVAVTGRTMARAGGRRDPTPPRGVTGTSCGDLLADNFRELWFSGISATKTWATHFDVAGTAVHGREDELGQDDEGHHPV